jgi:hypothetical protein
LNVLGFQKSTPCSVLAHKKIQKNDRMHQFQVFPPIPGAAMIAADWKVAFTWRDDLHSSPVEKNLAYSRSYFTV